MTTVKPCRECGRPMIWTTTLKGKRMPVDADPTDSGTFGLFYEGDLTPLAVHVKNATSRKGWNGKLYMPHHATCPQVAKFR